MKFKKWRKRVNSRIRNIHITLMMLEDEVKQLSKRLEQDKLERISMGFDPQFFKSKKNNA